MTGEVHNHTKSSIIHSNITKTHCNDVRFPMLYGILPLNWLSCKSRLLITRRRQAHSSGVTMHSRHTPKHTALSLPSALESAPPQHNIPQTYCNDVRFPMLSGILPLNWLSDISRCLIIDRQPLDWLHHTLNEPRHCTLPYRDQPHSHQRNCDTTFRKRTAMTSGVRCCREYCQPTDCQTNQDA